MGNYHHYDQNQGIKKLNFHRRGAKDAEKIFSFHLPTSQRQIKILSLSALCASAVNIKKWFYPDCDNSDAAGSSR